MTAFETVTSGGYQHFDHHDPATDLLTVHDTWSALRAECPIGRSNEYGGMWVVTGYAEAQEILQQPATFSSCPASFPSFPTAGRTLPVELDPPEHRKYRALLNSAFSPRMADTYEAPLRRIVNDLIDDFVETGSCEIYDAMAVRLPAALGAIMLGLPSEDAEKLHDWVDQIVHQSAKRPEIAAEAAAAVYEYFGPLLVARGANPPGDDMLSILIRAELDGERLTEAELLGFSFFLLLAALDTTQKAIGSIFWQLATEPELRAHIAADPSITPQAIEEFLRFWGPVFNTRTATHDVEVAGIEMKAGDRILILLGAANRDERAFPHGDEFVLDRAPNRHLTFGSHIHRCLGAYIARLELRVMLDEFLRRIPEFEVADPTAVRWSSGQVQGVVHLPIRFPPGLREGVA